MAQLQAQLAQYQARLAQAQIRAPADGVLLEREVEVGDLLTAGSARLSFAAAGPKHVVLDVDERQLAQLASGQPALIAADAFPTRRVAGKVGRIAAQVDNDRGTLEVEVLLGEISGDPEIRYTCIVRDLTDERAAQETSELYERALASSHNAVFITNGKMEHQPIVYINNAFQKFVDLPRWDILGESLALLRGKNADDPGVRELTEAVREHRNANVTIHRELENGEIQIAEVSLSPVMSDKARNMPVDSIITTIITSVMVRIRMGSNTGPAISNGSTRSNHWALATFSNDIRPMATAITAPMTMPSSTEMLARKPLA